MVANIDLTTDIQIMVMVVANISQIIVIQIIIIMVVLVMVVLVVLVMVVTDQVDQDMVRKLLFFFLVFVCTVKFKISISPVDQLYGERERKKNALAR